MKDSIRRARAELNSLQFSTNEQTEPLRPEKPKEFSSEHAFCIYSLGQRLGVNLQLNERASYGGDIIFRKKETRGFLPGLLAL